MKSGVKDHLNLSAGSKEEQRIIHKFGKVFEIGFYREDLFKQVRNRFFFAKPTELFNIKFNIESEILVLFNDMEEFETRTFDFVDKLNADYHNRIDKICVVIVSRDEMIVTKAEALNAKQEMTRIVVPFTYSELLESQQESLFIENRFRKFFYSRDLYDLDSPIRTDNFFFGRNFVVQQFYDKYINAENSSLFGLRKIGKTSVLYAVRRLCESREVPAIYIDCTSPSFHKKRWFEALRHIINVSAIQIADIKTEWFTDSDYNEKDAAMYFEQDFRKLKLMSGGKRLLLIFDEIENLTFDLSPSEHWRKGEDFLLFWQTIRSIFQSDRDLFSFIIAGVNPTILEKTAVNGFDNPIFNIATPQYLELFKIETSKEMVSSIGSYMGLSFDEEVFYLLHEDFGGHPFLTRIACSSINKLIGIDRPKKVSKYWYKDNRSKFVQQVLNYVDQLLHVLKVFYPNEYSLLEILASGDKTKFTSILGSMPSAGKHLQGYGVINTTNDEYYFKLKILEEYIQEYSTLMRVLNTKEEKIAEVSKRRNSVEDKLKRLARIILHANYGQEAKDKFISVMPSERRTKVQNLNLDEILSDHYMFIDIMQLIVKEFHLFKNIFEKQDQKFYTSLDHINKFRIDAHAKDIQDDDLQMLILEFNWVEKCISKMSL